MRIIIDARTTQDEIKFNGVGRYSRFIIQYLVKLFPTQEYVLIMYDSPSTLDDFLKLNYENVRIVRIGKFNDQGIFRLILHNLDLFFHISLNKALRKIGTKEAVFFSPYFWRGLPILDIKTYVTIHDFALPKYDIYSTISPIHNKLRKIHYWYELYRLQYCERILSDSTNTTNDIVTYLPKVKREKIDTILLGIEEDRKEVEFEKYLPSDWRNKGYILYLGGGLTKNKNSEGVVNAFEDFITELKLKGVREFPYLVIAGKNFTSEVSRNAKQFRELVEKSSIKDLIHFTGFYEDEVRWKLLDNARIFIHLSLYEGFGFSIAEAMRAKVPVIAHNGSSYPEVAGNGAMLVNGESVVEVSKALYKVFTDPNFAKELGERGYVRSLDLKWEKCAKETYKSLTM